MSLKKKHPEKERKDGTIPARHTLILPHEVELTFTEQQYVIKSKKGQTIYLDNWSQVATELQQIYASRSRRSWLTVRMLISAIKESSETVKQEIPYINRYMAARMQKLIAENNSLRGEVEHLKAALKSQSPLSIPAETKQTAGTT